MHSLGTSILHRKKGMCKGPGAEMLLKYLREQHGWSKISGQQKKRPQWKWEAGSAEDRRT